MLQKQGHHRYFSKPSNKAMFVRMEAFCFLVQYVEVCIICEV